MYTAKTRTLVVKGEICKELRPERYWLDAFETAKEYLKAGYEVVMIEVDSSGNVDSRYMYWR